MDLSEVPHSRNPFPGPRPFEQDDQNRFFGRDEESSELGYLLTAHPAVLLYAQSGAGKTSLLNAGLRKVLHDRRIDVLPLARVGSPAPPNVDIGSIANLYTFSAISSWFGQKEESAEGAPAVPEWMLSATLADGMAHVPRELDEAAESMIRVLIFDQFEEIFFSYERKPDRSAFFEQVAAALKDDINLRALFAIREEYLAAFDAEAPVLPEAVRTRFRLERLRQPAALAAVKGPLAATDVKFEQGVGEALVEDLLKVQVEDPRGQAIAVAGEFVEPVQLQLVCQNLFDHISPKEHLITMSHLRRFGSADDALQSFYQQALTTTTNESKVAEADLRTWFERQLITPALTRGTVFRGKEETGGIRNEAVALLEKQHLIRAEYRSGSRWYELTHDRFIRPILKSNFAWQSERATGNLAVVYDEAIQEILKTKEVEEGALRGWFDALYTANGSRTLVKPEGLPPAVLKRLMEVQLLKVDTRGYYSLMNDALVTVIQKSNQAWKANQWSAARDLGDLESQAAEWASLGTDSLLLQREDLTRAEEAIRATKLAGIQHTTTLDVFLKASREKARRSLMVPLGVLVILQAPLIYWLVASFVSGSSVIRISWIPVRLQAYQLLITAVAAEIGAFLNLLIGVSGAVDQPGVSWNGIVIWTKPLIGFFAGIVVHAILLSGDRSIDKWRALLFGFIAGVGSDRILSQINTKLVFKANASSIPPTGQHT